MSDEIILAWIGVIGTVLTGIVGKLSVDTHRNRRDTREIHESINNRTDAQGRPVSVSDRLDLIQRAVDRHADELARHGRAFDRIEDGINELHAADARLRLADGEGVRIAEHALKVAQTAMEAAQSISTPPTAPIPTQEP